MSSSPRWEKAAEAYATGEHKSGHDLELVVEFANPGGYERELDVGAGAGHTALALAPYVHFVIVTDPVEGMLAAARQVFARIGVSNAEFVHATAERLPFDDASFEIATCRLAAHHFEDVGLAMHEIARVLRHGGRFILVDTLAPEDAVSAHFQDEVELLRDPTHRRIYRKDQWIAFCENAGLHVERAEVVAKSHRFEAWLERGGEDAPTMQRVRERFLNAPPSAIRDLGITIADGTVTSFTDNKLVLGTRRRSMMEQFSTPRSNLIESNSGFSTEVMGMTGMRYVEGGRSMHLDSEVLARPNAIGLWRASVGRWDPPHDAEPVGSDDRIRILENIRRAFESQGQDVDII